MPPRGGTRLGPYLVEAPIGAGGMSACGRDERAQRVEFPRVGGGAPRAPRKADPEPMPLNAGTRLGPYLVEAPIGAGGMSACGRDERAQRVEFPRVGGGAPRAPRSASAEPMPLNAGTRLGPYLVEAPIGAGGM